MERIESRDNLLIRDIKKLKDKKWREKTGRFIVEGLRFTIESLKSSFPVPYIFILESKEEKINGSGLYESLNPDTKVYILSSKAFNELKGTESSQGIIAVVCFHDFIKEGAGFFILCDKIQDPGNLGNIIRCGHAFNCSGIILTSGTADPYNEKTLRSTMGSIFKVPVIKDSELTFTRNLKEKGYSLISASLKGSCDLDKTKLPEKSIIALGNEGNGISDEIYSISDILVKINMLGDSESLNVSSAASIIIYEYAKQNIYS